MYNYTPMLNYGMLLWGPIRSDFEYSCFYRFKEDLGEIATLRAKEAGDWKKMTKEEKKVLYRASFCQTLAEVEAPTGEWKSVSRIVYS